MTLWTLNRLKLNFHRHHAAAVAVAATAKAIAAAAAAAVAVKEAVATAVSIRRRPKRVIVGRRCIRVSGPDLDPEVALIQGTLITAAGTRILVGQTADAAVVTSAAKTTVEDSSLATIIHLAVIREIPCVTHETRAILVVAAAAVVEEEVAKCEITNTAAVSTLNVIVGRWSKNDWSSNRK